MQHLARAIRLIAMVVLLIGVPEVAGQVREPELPASMRRYETPYYIMMTDLDVEHAREAAIRMTRMAEEYYNRTREFSGQINQKLPFILFSKADDYLRAGGTPGSAGVFMGSRWTGFRLMALADEGVNERTWHVVQHEGFHQFVHAVIGGDLPIWVNEGLAEYFGEAIFTGDGFVTGVIPPWRLKRLKEGIEANQYLPVNVMMMVSHDQWNQMLNRANYDQAWAMVHFLAHADDGKYQAAFVKFMRGVSNGMNWQAAWMGSLRNPAGFEESWRAYWMGLPDNPTEDLYVRATAERLASFAVRAAIAGQTFESWEAFVEAAESGSLKLQENNWLPPSLLTAALQRARQHGRWSLTNAGRVPAITVEMDDLTRITAGAVLKRDKVERIRVEIDWLARGMGEARQMAAKGDVKAAREHLQGAIKANPQSPMLAEARAALRELR